MRALPETAPVSLAAITFAGLVFHATVQAQPVVVNFDDVPAWGNVTDHYADRGITFNAPFVLDYSALGMPGFAHSGEQAIEHCYAQEFCAVPIDMSFTADQARVKVWVGYSAAVQSRVTVFLRGFDGAGGLVGEASTVFEPGASPQPIRTALEVARQTAVIRRAQVIGRVESGGDTIYYIALDDVEFDTVGPPPPCPATQVPAVTLSRPDTGLNTQVKQVLIQGSFFTQAPIQEATLTISAAGGSHTMNLFNLVPPNGGSFGPWWTSPIYPGTNTVVARFRNCFGTGQAVRTFTHTAIDPATRLVFLGMEVTQCIQNMDNFVPLIAGKTTIARVYLHTSGPTRTLREVRGTLTATVTDGSQAPGPASIQSLNAITVNDGTSIQAKRRDLNASLNFELPPEWTAEGRLHLVLSNLTVETIPTALPCDGCDNRFMNQRRLVTFEDAPPLRVVLWSVPYVQAGVTHEPRDVDFERLRSWLRRAYPTASLLQSAPVRRLNAFSGVPDSDFDCDDVNARLFRSRAYCILNLCFDTVDHRTRYYGLVSDAVDFMRGCSRGIPSRVASGPSGSSTWGWDSDGSYADWYGGHELAHTYDRKHPGFCNGNSDDDDDFPYPSGLISHSVLDEFGFDVGDPGNSIARAVYAPDNWKDVMTYCDNQWISQYTYEGILDYTREIEGDGGALVEGDGAGGGAGESLLVMGKLNLLTDEVRLQTFSRHVGLELTQRPTTSRYTIDLLDAGGGRLARYPFDPAVETEPGPEGPQRATITEIILWIAATRQIVIAKDGVTRASRTVSASAPAARMLFPNGGESLLGTSVQVRWQASDADGDPLTYTLLYSASGGQSWHALRDGLASLQETVDLGELAGSNAALFRVIANDGVNTGMDDSDATFQVPFKPPVARIISPGDDSSYTRDQTVVFSGEAFDVEDADLDGTGLLWRSSVQGVLGTGAALAVTGLVRGEHAITLAARDSSGAQGADTIQIRVADALPVADAGPDRLVPAGSTVQLDGSKSSGFGDLAFQWTLLSRPAGSAASLSTPQSPRAAFVADRLGAYDVQLEVTAPGGLAGIAVAQITASLGTPFRRGDANASGKLDISDAIFLLDVLFRGGRTFTCLDAGDANDDGRVDISDAIYDLGFLFQGGRAPPVPFPDCGLDATGDAIGCAGAAGCE